MRNNFNSISSSHHHYHSNTNNHNNHHHHHHHNHHDDSNDVDDSSDMMLFHLHGVTTSELSSSQPTIESFIYDFEPGSWFYTITPIQYIHYTISAQCMNVYTTIAVNDTTSTGSNTQYYHHLLLYFSILYNI